MSWRRETAPQFEKKFFTNLLKEIPELAVIEKLSKRKVFPDNLSFFQKLLVVRMAAFDRLLQLQFLKAYAVEYEYADPTRRQIIENEIAQKFSIKTPMTQKVLEIVSALDLPPNLTREIFRIRRGGIVEYEKYGTIRAKIEFLIRQSSSSKLLINTLSKNAQKASREMVRVLSNSSNSKKT